MNLNYQKFRPKNQILRQPLEIDISLAQGKVRVGHVQILAESGIIILGLNFENCKFSDLKAVVMDLVVITFTFSSDNLKFNHCEL